jgi:hypothetical protein
MQEINLETTKRMIGLIKDQPIGELSEKQIKRYFKKEYGTVLCPFDEFDARKSSKNSLQVREEFSQDALIELLGVELFREVFINPINMEKGNRKYGMEVETEFSKDDLIFDFMRFGKLDKRRLQRKSEYCINKNGSIILMGALKMQRKIIGILNLEGSKADIAKQTKDMIETAATSSYVSIDPLQITAALGYSKAYGDSDAAGVEQAHTNLINALQAILFEFQNFANNNPTKALDVFKTGGFGTKTITPRGKQPWGLKNTRITGIMKATHEGGPLRSAHDWWISLKGDIFTRLCPTIAAEIEIKGLKEGDYVHLMHQLITKDGPQGFDLVIKKMCATL